jgi:hypothetical protein
MLTPRFLTCFAFLALAPLVSAQTPPTAYTIKEALPGPNAGTMIIYRNGAQVLIQYDHPAQPDGTPASRSLSLYDLKAGVSRTWDPTGKPITCSAGTFSGDWGDPFQSTKELTDSIAKGDLKPVGAETISGIPTKVYAGTTQGANLKAWFDQKDGLVVRLAYGAPGAAMTNMVDIRSVSFTSPPASLLALPATCANVKPPPTPAELIAAETGDSAANFVNAIFGPGSQNTCSILVHVVAAKTMAPLNRKYQAAIDTTYNQNAPRPGGYTFGVRDDGTSTYSGGGLHEITNQIHNYTLRIDNPPAYFQFGINIPTPHHGADVGLIYRQCFAPVTNLYWVVKDPANPADGGDWLYAKAGKYAAPAH